MPTNKQKQRLEVTTEENQNESSLIIKFIENVNIRNKNTAK
jgi:hypothetical protein